MSAAAASDAAPPKKGNKKLIVIGAVVALVLAAAGGGAVYFLKSKAARDAEQAEQAEDSEDAPAEHAAPKRDPKAVPTFVPLDTFTVNLADREVERYAQVGITLELEDAKTGELVKTFMPAIRNNILMALADKTAAQLTEREGKLKLAEQIRRETARALGVDVAEPEAEAEAAPVEQAPTKKRKKKEPELPVKAVHFSNFIIQ